ncbi:MAG TPA: hypothetical protein CFH81_09300 [Sulfurovum sp. UBA12169]|nr:MAG TPA: hypothetical protein CFH81_09300 [Sulfurovum sp. UBA12169]
MRKIKILLPFLMTGFLCAASGKSIYDKTCAGCHGYEGEKVAAEHSKAIKGMSAEEIVEDVEQFASGKKKAMPIAKIYKKNLLDRYSKEEIRSVAEYISTL